MQQLIHPNIVKYIDTIRTEGFLHILLEFMENGSLSNVIRKFGSFSESLSAIYVTQVRFYIVFYLVLVPTAQLLIKQISHL